MNAKLFKLIVLVFFLAIGTQEILAQVYTQNVIGYWNSIFMVGSNLFNNPLQAQSTNINSLFQPNSMISPFPIPEGATVSLWNPATRSYETNSVFTNGSWSVDLVLPPGTGALIVTPMQFTNSIEGYVLNHDGSPFAANGPLLPPPLFSSANGIYLLGDKSPIIDAGTNIFLNIIGRMPFVGEQVISLSGTSTYLGNGMWDSIPTLGIGEAAFLNVMTEPSPLLSIACTNNQAIVSWPFSPSSWTLQTNSDLATGSWGNYAGTIVNNTVTNPPSAGNLFFRLSYP